MNRRTARRVGAAVLGFCVLGIGLALLFLPAPAILVIPVGLAILSTEFGWARRWLGAFRGLARRLRRLGRRAVEPSPSALAAPVQVAEEAVLVEPPETADDPGSGNRCASCHGVRILGALEELGDSGFCQRCLAGARVRTRDVDVGGSG